MLSPFRKIVIRDFAVDEVKISVVEAYALI